MRKLATSEIKRLSAGEYRDAPKLPLVVVLDDVRSQYNVGSVFRTADAFAAQGVFLCGITAQPPTAEIHKTALGAETTVGWRHFATAAEAVDFLHGEGYTVFAAEQCEGSLKVPVGKLDPDKRYAVVMGNEVKGVSQEAVDKCDGCLEIPQYGTKHSLNVAVAAGIIIWEFSRNLRRRG